MVLNRKWHETHRMPKNATREQRLRWHIAHAEYCGCRAIPESLKSEIGRARKVRKAARRG
jgi:hypothetical protein